MNKSYGNAVDREIQSMQESNVVYNVTNNKDKQANLLIAGTVAFMTLMTVVAFTVL